MSRLTAALAALAFSACAPLHDEETAQGDALPGSSEVQSSTSALTIENGGSLNGGSLNGGSLNGGSLNGGSLNGNDLSSFLVSVDYALASVNGSSDLEWVRIEGTTFRAKKGAVIYSGDDFIDSMFYGNLGDGRRATLRVSAMRQAAAPNSDLTEYWVEYQDDAGSWHPICRDSTNTPVWAYPVRGVYDYRSGVPTGGAHVDDPARFTFACGGGAIVKCINLGYRPWATKDGEPLAPYHQACTRMLRADYCGDGSSYTQNGNRVNMYDPLGIQQDTEHWVFEANWDENGARCFYPLNRSHAGIPCYDQRVELFCGTDLSSHTIGIRLTNETPTAGLTP
jgi:hypothetical protein